MLEALAHPYRRELLLAPLEDNPQDRGDVDPLNTHAADEEAFSQYNIFMGHLPKLDRMGIIEWKKKEDEIIKGPEWEEYKPLLRLIAENKNELPE
jgi:hypothetical protein